MRISQEHVPKIKAMICTIVVAVLLLIAYVSERGGAMIMVSVFGYTVYDQIFLPYFQKIHSKEDEP